jgi:sigma-B regulation protein RsbU (phosphoserine phosphatase)
MSLERISGDFFEFIRFDKHCFGFIFADVSGHGVPAALYAAMLKTAIDTHVSRDVEPDKTMSGMNAFLIGAQKKMSYNYATVFYGLFDLDAGKLTYCNAGIPAPAVLKKNGEVHLLEPNGPFVGIFNTSEYVSESILIGKGDKIIFYTDGAFECVNCNEEIYGRTGFLKIIESRRGEDIGGIVNSAYRTVEEFCGPGGFSDDVMILGMHRE